METTTKFDWHPESKEHYYREVEVKIKTAGYADFLKIDKKCFLVRGKETAVIYMEPMKKKGNFKKWHEAKKALGFKKKAGKKDSYGREIDSILLTGFFEIQILPEHLKEVPQCSN